MRPIGGEPENQLLNEKVYFLDSGRSAIRFFAQNIDKSLKVLIPDFLCSVIEDILHQEDISYDYYHVSKTLDIDENDILTKNFDILYIINYFGKKQQLNINLNDKIVIEDNVFFDDFENDQNYIQWFGFNSYRKISALSDGSMIKTNLPLKQVNIIQKEAAFVAYKERAKDIKYKYVFNNTCKESEYLELFEKGEEILNAQRDIYQMSDSSFYKLKYKDIYNDQLILKNRFLYVKKRLGHCIIDFQPKYYSFVVLSVNNRDKLRYNLMQKSIFLPIHWPMRGKNNTLYHSIISIPLFTNYREEEFYKMIEIIEKELNE